MIMNTVQHYDPVLSELLSALKTINDALARMESHHRQEALRKAWRRAGRQVKAGAWRN